LSTFAATDRVPHRREGARVREVQALDLRNGHVSLQRGRERVDPDRGAIGANDAPPADETPRIAVRDERHVGRRRARVVARSGASGHRLADRVEAGLAGRLLFDQPGPPGLHIERLHDRGARDLAHGRGVAGDRGADCPPGPVGGEPERHPRLLAGDGVDRGRAVARGVHVREARPPVLVRADRAALAGLDAGPVEQFGVRTDADADDREVGGDRVRRSVERDAFDPVVADERLHGSSPVDRHALRLQFVRDALADGLPERREQVAGALEEVHVEPATGQGLGHLDADVAATDDRRRLGSRHRGVAVDALAVDCAHVGAGGVVGVRFGDVRVDRGRGVHVVKGEGAVQPAHVEGEPVSARPPVATSRSS